MKKYQVTAEMYSAFPNEFDDLLEIFSYYSEYIFDKKQNDLNRSQKAFSYYYLVDGMINNSGVFSILLESLGEYNDGYLEALRLSKNNDDEANFQKLVVIFQKYQDYFMEQELPPVLDDEDKSFDKSLDTELDLIEQKWYDNTDIRDNNFKAFLIQNKDDLLEINK